MAVPDILTAFLGLAGTVPERTDSSNQGGGFVNVIPDHSSYGNTNELAYQDSSLFLQYSPTTNTTTLNYITLSDSWMSGSANSRTETPGTISTQQKQEAAQAATDSTGLDLPGLIIPLAAVAAVGGVGYAVVKGFSSGKSKGGK